MKLTVNEMLQHAVNIFKEGKTEKAQHLFQNIIKIEPTHLDANHYLAISLQILGKLEDAVVIYKKTIKLNPEYSSAHQNLGNTLIQLKKFEEAELSYRKVIELDPDNVIVHLNLGNNLRDLNKLEEAELSYRKVIELDPDNADAYNALGNSLFEVGKFEEAELSYKKAIELKPDFASAYNSLGNTLKDLNKLEEAELSYRKAIELNPTYAEAYHGLGNRLLEVGKFEEAELSYKKAIKLKPNYAKTYRTLAYIKNFNNENDLFIKMQNLYHDKNLNDEDRCQLSFALGKVYEDLNQFDKSFKLYTEGNALKKKLLNYDAYQDTKIFDQLKKAYPEIKKNSLRISNESYKPKIIFILGMPRSGTSLVEQIISTHSEVLGTGELKYANMFGDNIARGISPIDSEILENFRKNYLKKVQALSDGTLVITDKAPLNFKYIGLICSTIPGVKIINVERNVEATCWSCYKQYFSKNSLGFTYNFDDLINFYKLYQNIISFWKKEYGEQIYSLCYERLTVNQEDETKKIFQFLGLKWEIECLSPQNNKRNVSTASVIQVRQKIYQNSSQEWKKFEPFLNGVFNQLNNIL